jgi:hypothetical protein
MWLLKVAGVVELLLQLLLLRLRLRLLLYC